MTAPVAPAGRPFFSVLIPTRNRAAFAASCVRTVLAQGHGSFELLVLDQSDGEATRLAVAEAAAGSPRVSHHRVGGTGRSRALNAGIPLARGEWVVLIDDDCEAAPGWLAALEAEARRAGPRAAIVGRVAAGRPEPGTAPPPSTIEDPEPADFAGRIARDPIHPNFAIPRAAFDEIGRFDVRMSVGTRLPGGEDNDFGYRLLRRGWRILYRPDPTVVHRAWRSHGERADLKRAYGLGQGAFYGKHIASADPFIAYRLLRDIVGTVRAAGGALLRGWREERRGHVAFLSGLMAGVVVMLGLTLRGVPAEDGR